MRGPKHRGSSPPAALADLDGQIKGKVDEYLRTFKSRREGRITASAVAIAWSIVLYVFFNYFNQYVAYYHSEKIGNTVTLIREPFFTGEISSWLPILSATLAVSILGHIVMIIVDKRVLHEVIHIVINGFGLATIVSLIRIFPFDFNAIPNPTAADATHTALTVALICVGIGLGISVLVRVIKLIANTARGITDYQ